MYPQSVPKLHYTTVTIVRLYVRRYTMCTLRGLITAALSTSVSTRSKARRDPGEFGYPSGMSLLRNA